MKHYEFHPIAEIFPMMSEREMGGLIESMRENGYDESEPIILFEGKILDGRNRYRSAPKADAAPVFKDYDGVDPVAFVIQKNLHRRHLSESQRAMVASNLASFRHGGNRGKFQAAILPLEKEGKNTDNEKPSLTIDEAAEAMDVSPRVVRDARKVQEQAEPEVVKAVETGEVSVSDAAKVADKPKVVQKEALDAKRKGKARTVAGAAKQIEEQREPEQQKDAPKDATGKTLPDKLITPFEAAKEIGTLCRDLDGIIKKIDEAGRAVGGEMLHTTSQVQTLRNVRKSLWQSRATHICPYCRANKKSCDACKGRGWVTAAVYESAPQDTRELK